VGCSGFEEKEEKSDKGVIRRKIRGRKKMKCARKKTGMKKRK
jgi:hypothetical protein